MRFAVGAHCSGANVSPGADGEEITPAGEACDDVLG
jgi:hypothetical protein